MTKTITVVAYAVVFVVICISKVSGQILEEAAQLCLNHGGVLYVDRIKKTETRVECADGMELTFKEAK